MLRHYVEHDLLDGKVRLSGDALLSDAESVFFADIAWESLEVPVRFLFAEWSSGSDTAPAYPKDAVDSWRHKLVEARFVPGVDHAGSIMSPTGAAVTAELIRDAIA